MADNPKADKATKHDAPDKEGKDAKDSKGGKGKDAPKEAKKTTDYGPDFQHRVRIINTDLDGTKPFTAALTYIPGVSDRMANIIARESGVDPKARIGTLKEAQLTNVAELIENVGDLVPVWMMNRRKDVESGVDDHLVGTEIAIVLREDLNRLKKIRSWRGHRHEKKLPTRGQRTKANGRFGSAVGVQRKDIAGAPPAEGAAAGGAPAGKAGGGGAKPLGGAKPAAAPAAAAPAAAKPAAGAAKPAAKPAEKK